MGDRGVPCKQRRPAFDDVSGARRANMRAIRGRDTQPEVTVRRLLHAMGYRFRVQRRDLPGRPDIVLPGRMAVIDVRGCFWHRHDDPACKNAVLPKARREWWETKLARNSERDRANQTALEARGWRVLVLWECQIAEGRMPLADRLRSFLGPPGRASVLSPG